ncbi:putative acetyltransferase At3g50280 [Silene latifolia]|uniref:putative acetyltransferase At3g50280 n=1 Tax=Silene latifolia TaxID=37657 RepID=UPI003D770C9C
MESNNLEVKLISECFIKPKSQVEESKTPYYLVGEDLICLSLRYIQTGFLYNKPITNDFDINTFVEKMKQSLSHALVYYYPLAGRFTTVTYPDEHALSIHVDCNKGPGVRFIHASCLGATVADIAGHTAYTLPLIRSFIDLGETGVVNYDGHTRALLNLQVTELKDGVFIGFGLNHSIADGVSFMNFLNCLSEISLSETSDKLDISVSSIPILKPYIPDGCNLLQKLPYLEEKEFISRVKNDPRLQEKFFHFSPLSISNLKKRVNSEWPEGLGKVSSFQSLAALTWISINRAQKAPAQKIAVCLIQMDCRSRFNPPLSLAQFGNPRQTLVLNQDVGELIENGLTHAAMVIHQGITGYDHEVATEKMTEFMKNPFVIRLDEDFANFEHINLTPFAWATRFNIYGVDFGLGKPVAVPTGDNDKKEGIVFTKAARDGGVDFEVSLFPESMIALESDREFMEYASSV